MKDDRVRFVTSSGMPEDVDAFSLGLVAERPDTPEPEPEVEVEIRIENIEEKKTGTDDDGSTVYLLDEGSINSESQSTEASAPPTPVRTGKGIARNPPSLECTIHLEECISSVIVDSQTYYLENYGRIPAQFIQSPVIDQLKPDLANLAMTHPDLATVAMSHPELATLAVANPEMASQLLAAQFQAIAAAQGLATTQQLQEAALFAAQMETQPSTSGASTAEAGPTQEELRATLSKNREISGEIKERIKKHAEQKRQKAKRIDDIINKLPNLKSKGSEMEEVRAESIASTTSDKSAVEIIEECSIDRLSIDTSDQAIIVAAEETVDSGAGTATSYTLVGKYEEITPTGREEKPNVFEQSMELPSETKEESDQEIAIVETERTVQPLKIRLPAAGSDREGKSKKKKRDKKKKKEKKKGSVKGDSTGAESERIESPALGTPRDLSEAESDREHSQTDGQVVNVESAETLEMKVPKLRLKIKLGGGEELNVTGRSLSQESTDSTPLPTPSISSETPPMVGGLPASPPPKSPSMRSRSPSESSLVMISPISTPLKQVEFVSDKEEGPGPSTSFVTPSRGDSDVEVESVDSAATEEVKEEDEGWNCPKCGVAYDENGPDMIGCDNCDRWYHWKCMGIKEEPKSKKWFCKDCSTSSKPKKKPTAAPKPKPKPKRRPNVTLKQKKKK